MTASEMIDLIKAWANWARTKRHRQTCGSAEGQYRAPSDIDTDIQIPSGITLQDIYACDDAWRQLPIKYRRLIRAVYILRLPDVRAARQSGIPIQQLKHHHDRAIRMMRQQLQHIKKTAD